MPLSKPITFTNNPLSVNLNVHFSLKLSSKYAKIVNMRLQNPIYKRARRRKKLNSLITLPFLRAVKIYLCVAQRTIHGLIF